MLILIWLPEIRETFSSPSYSLRFFIPLIYLVIMAFIIYMITAIETYPPKSNPSNKFDLSEFDGILDEYIHDLLWIFLIPVIGLILFFSSAHM